MKKHEHEQVEPVTETPHLNQSKQEETTTQPITPEEQIKQLEEQLAAKDKESKENWDRFLRERADMENLRKRANREKEELLSYCNKSLIEEILPVVDNLERALEHANEDTLPALVEGVRMTHNMLLTALKKFGVSPIESAGAPFDPAYHQAMSQVVTDEHPPNTVVTQFQKGYMLKERLLRPAMVSVSAAAK